MRYLGHWSVEIARVSLFPRSLVVAPLAFLLTLTVGLLAFLLALTVSSLPFLLALPFMPLAFLLALSFLALGSLLIRLQIKLQCSKFHVSSPTSVLRRRTRFHSSSNVIPEHRWANSSVSKDPATLPSVAYRPPVNDACAYDRNNCGSRRTSSSPALLGASAPDPADRPDDDHRQHDLDGELDPVDA